MGANRVVNTCSTCTKQFMKVVEGDFSHMAVVLSRQAEGACCFDCTLAQITQGRCPEEGDYNTARIVSGEMSDEDILALRSDLEVIEPHDPFEDEWDAAERYDQDDYREVACRRCGQIDDCTCDDWWLDGSADIRDRQNPYLVGEWPVDEDDESSDDDLNKK